MTAISTVWVLWVFLANGNIATREFPDLKSCLTVQRVIADDHEVRGDRRIDRMMCLPIDARALTDPAQRVDPPLPANR